MDEVATAVPGTRLCVAGAGRRAESILDFGEPRPPWLDVEIGYVERDRVVPLFARASAVVLPYREASQSGVAALALGLGRPVVATKVGGLEELVRHGHNGLLVPPNDPRALAEALIQVLQDTRLRHSMARHAAEFARTTLAWDRISADTAQVYREAIDDYASSRGGR
jgi:glycosyltransferase involved in cell wall biosynthesis